jgi:hypothetical protein
VSYGEPRGRIECRFSGNCNAPLFRRQRAEMDDAIAILEQMIAR